MCGYHITVTPWIAGDREARETLGLTKEESEQVVVLRDCILRRSFREMDTIEEHEWQNQMSCALKWPEHASRMRLIQVMKESEIQNVELPTWYVMESKGGEDWLRPSHPMTEDRDLDEQEEVTYAVAARVPECTLWNLLDCRDEDGVPLVEWLRFIQARSQVDQDWVQAVMTRAHVGWIRCVKECSSVGRWLTIDIVEQNDNWRPLSEVLMGRAGVLTTIQASPEGCRTERSIKFEPISSLSRGRHTMIERSMI
jgi:hypothetical protein